jgi:hypothetical protein
VPSGFSGRVMAHVRSRPASGTLSWSTAPGWVRATAAAALIAGAALGIGVGRSLPATAGSVDADAEPAPTLLSSTDDTSLADSYWSLVEDATTDDETEAMP